jgi:hypothetical protein
MFDQPYTENEEVHEGAATPGPAASVNSARSADTIRPYSTSPHPVPSASDVQATDDKQELEQQRLIAQASAPPTDDPEAGSGLAAPPFAPSAPVITGEDLEHGPSQDVDAESELPQYQR